MFFLLNTMNYRLIAVVAIAAAALMLVVKFLSYPVTNYQCKIEASRAPTSYGAQLAEEACEKHF